MTSVPDWMRRGLPAVLGLGIFLVAVEVLRRELQTVTWDTLSTDVLGTPPSLLAWALALTALNYAVLTGYDFIAFAYIGKRFTRARVAMTSFIAYAVANNVGFAMLSGASAIEFPRSRLNAICNALFKHSRLRFRTSTNNNSPSWICGQRSYL